MHDFSLYPRQQFDQGFMHFMNLWPDTKTTHFHNHANRVLRNLKCKPQFLHNTAHSVTRCLPGVEWGVGDVGSGVRGTTIS